MKNRNKIVTIILLAVTYGLIVPVVSGFIGMEVSKKHGDNIGVAVIFLLTMVDWLPYGSKVWRIAND